MERRDQVGPTLRKILRQHGAVRAARILNSLLRGTPFKLVPQSTLTPAWFDQLLFFQRLLDRVRGVEGDIVECGVAGGRSLALLASLARHGEQPRHVWGFDWWRGLPAGTAEDLAANSPAARPGLFAETSEQEVLMRLEQHGVTLPLQDVTLVNGHFRETLQRAQPPIALLHLDVDLYESYLECLTHLWPKLADGGITVFDEYEHPSWPGATRAVDEYFSSLRGTEFRIEHDAGAQRYFATKLNAPAKPA